MSKARDLADLAKNANDRLDTVATSDGALSNRNLIINGAMQVAQRGTSSTSVGYSTVDRFSATSDGTMSAAVITQSQEPDGPDGFVNSYKVSVSTSETVASVDYYYIRQTLEAQNLQHLGFGTSGAKALTLSFWVKSSVTGTYTVSTFRHDAQRIFPKTYQIQTTNTWEYKTIVMDGDTTGTIANDNGRGIDVYWVLSAGSNYTTGTDNQWAAYVTSNFAANHSANIVGTTGATFQITGVQLEVGDTATSFEHRPYGDELARCQRYYFKSGGNQLSIANASTAGYSFRSPREKQTSLPVTMRASPTFTRVTAQSNLSGGVNLSGDANYAYINAVNYAGDIPSAAYDYGGFTADAEL